MVAHLSGDDELLKVHYCASNVENAVATQNKGVARRCLIAQMKTYSSPWPLSYLPSPTQLSTSLRATERKR